MNTVNILGRMVASPELRATQSGKYVTGFTIAVNDGWGDNQKTYYVDCVAWQKSAELIAQHFPKGARISITGKLTTRQYEDKAGNKRKSVEVLVQDFDFLDSKKSDSSQQKHGSQSNDPFANDSKVVDISDDDMPF